MDKTWRLKRNPNGKLDPSRATPDELSTPECEILYWADRAFTLEEIAAKTALPPEDVFTAVRRFEANDIAKAGPFGAWGAPRAKQTLAALFREAVAAHADRNLLVLAAEGGEFTYADAADGVARVERALVHAGLAKGDVIAADADLTPEFALLFWAAMQRGVVVAALNPAWADAMVTDVIRESGAKLSFLPSRRAALKSGAIVFDSTVDEGSSPGGRLFSEWLEAAEGDSSAPLSPAAVDESDVAAVVFTSGTTGIPKGVKLSQGAFFRSGQHVAREYGWTKDDVLLLPGEFHSVGGLRNPLSAVLHAGASFVLTSAAQRRHPVSLVPVIQQTGATILTITPAFLVELGKGRERMPDAALPTVRQVLSCAAPLTPAAARALKPYPQIALGNFYGLTESTGAAVFSKDVDTTGEKPWRAGYVGRPVGVLAHIVGEDGRRVPAGTVGEVCLYSENGTSGYLTSPKEAAQILRNGWLYTGDLGVAAEDGTLTLKGRKRDIIKDDFGDIISPLEIEAVLGSDPGVEEAAVSGFSDPDTGREAAVVFVVPTASAKADELVGALKQRVLDTLGARKVPKHFQIVDTFPRNSLGKVVKRDLVENYLNARKAL